MFERTTTNAKTQQSRVATIRVFILIQGSTTSVNKFLSRFAEQDRPIFHDRIVLYHHMRSYLDLLDHHNITHLIDNRYTFIKKAHIATDFLGTASSCRTGPRWITGSCYLTTSFRP